MQQGELVSPNPQMESQLQHLATFSSFPESASFSPCVAFPRCQFVVSQPIDNGSAEQVNTENVSADELVSQSAPTKSGRESPQVSQSHNNQRRRRRDYNSRHDYYSQLPSVAGSFHASTGTSTERTSYVSSPFSATHVYTNVDRFTSRRMRERINNNDPALLKELKYENQRLSSFANWPRGTNIQPEALAQAGLFYLCRADRVKCAFCGGILRNWWPSEDPMRKHRNLSPDAPSCVIYGLLAMWQLSGHSNSS